MNVTELLSQLQAGQDLATAHVDSLQRQLDDLAAALAQAQTHLAELQTARKIVEGLVQPGNEPQTAATPDSYQRLLTVFNDHPGQPFRPRELHELLELPTDEASVNITRSRLGRLVRQGTLTQPGRGLYQKRT
ncbi:type IV toxin-antitoxin system AbiEi family antitoxin domain-containing protein [Kitasatospora phosalacinea]|uniref:AbiEi antitoxin N-terminal domain-containing protein n=1 Tax=Kitasatospora phosalacinea TaxID=2065 RepID=A0A9W6US32_9ACTN|nr:type IV toxin-antitoxin system AbiEi family antitoxin domain-containing protein [Kitasatospora phosalacinea]GLW59009.1 hypothetical protein Kpho01_70190 [Kitasatospora phosalacinea]